MPVTLDLRVAVEGTLCVIPGYNRDCIDWQPVTGIVPTDLTGP